MSPTLVLPWARFMITEVRFDRPAARNISPESSRPFPFASVRESEEAPCGADLMRARGGRAAGGGRFAPKTVAAAPESFRVPAHDRRRAVWGAAGRPGFYFVDDRNLLVRPEKAEEHTSEPHSPC